MSGTLSTAQIEAYNRDGYLMPLRAFSTEEAQKIRDEIEALELEFKDGVDGRSVNQFFRVDGHVTIPLMARIPHMDSILDQVQSILGPDLMVWSCELFIKEAGSQKVVTWHQDLTYWGLGETDHEASVWIAISDVSVKSGCMKFIPGSHKQNIVEHTDTFDENNLLSRGQEIAVDVNEDDAVFDELKPGEFSIHHGRLFHASGPNNSDDRRIGMVIRYISPTVQQQVAAQDYAMLVRGEDTSGNWIHISPPTKAFSSESVAMYDKILADKAVALAQGASETVGLYQDKGT